MPMTSVLFILLPSQLSKVYLSGSRMAAGTVKIIENRSGLIYIVSLQILRRLITRHLVS